MKKIAFYFGKFRKAGILLASTALIMLFGFAHNEAQASMSACAGLDLDFVTIEAGVGGGCNGISTALCTVVSWFTEGGVGAAIASLAVIFLGIGAFFGKVTWGTALTYASGIFAIFGAETLLSEAGIDIGGGCGFSLSIF